jgi:hypothetical protein
MEWLSGHPDDGADIGLRIEGMTDLLADLRAVRSESRRAA